MAYVDQFYYYSRLVVTTLTEIIRMMTKECELRLVLLVVYASSCTTYLELANALKKIYHPDC